MLTIEIDIDMLSATVEATRDLRAYYEADAAALARLDSQEAKELAQERLGQAQVAAGLFSFYAGL